jgi:hypothetical protein
MSDAADHFTSLQAYLRKHRARMLSFADVQKVVAAIEMLIESTDSCYSLGSEPELIPPSIQLPQRSPKPEPHLNGLPIIHLWQNFCTVSPFIFLFSFLCIAGVHQLHLTQLVRYVAGSRTGPKKAGLVLSSFAAQKFCTFLVFHVQQV